MTQSTPDFSALDHPAVTAHLFHPRPEYGPRTAPPDAQDFLIPVGGGIDIGACFHPAGKRDPVILFFHGNGEIVADYDDFGAEYSRRGINFLVVDYRGYGRSGGNPAVATMMTDCHVIQAWTRDWLAEMGYAGPLLIMGRSLGSASAIELAARRPDDVAGLIVESGFAFAGPLLRLLGIDPDVIGYQESNGFANAEKIATVRAPTLIIHAQYDHIIPFADGEALYERCGAARKQLVDIPGANHNDIFIRGFARYMTAVAQFAESMSSKPGMRDAMDA